MKFIVKTVFGLIYKILSVFNLQPTLFVALVGAVLYFTGVMNANSTVKFIFQVALILSLVYAVVETVKSLLGVKNKVKKSKNVEMLAVQGEKGAAVNGGGEIAAAIGEKPVYYRVKNHPDFVMAEYSDKYELFKVSGGDLIKIRTDYKG